MTGSVTLITNKVCPFAHRAWLTLLQKNVQFTMKEVDLIHKEPWFTQIYKKAYAHDPHSNGKVPILIHGHKIITESQLISWYIAETFHTGTQLIPKDTFQRLKMRKFIHEVPAKLISSFYSTKKYHLKSEAEQKQVTDKIQQNLRIVNKEILGPFVLGDTFGLADILLYPWLQRWIVNERIFGIHIPNDLTKIKSFVKAVQQRPAVQKAKSQVSEQFFIKKYSHSLKQ